MSNKTKYKIALKALHQGQNELNFKLDDPFFANRDHCDISGGEIDCQLIIDRSGEQYETTIRVEGYIVTNCARCLSPVEIDIENSLFVIIKLGDHFSDEGDDEIIIARSDAQWDAEELIYETIMFDMPLMPMHEDNECDEETEKALRAHETDSVKDEDANGEEQPIDPRWKALEGLKKKKD